MPLASATCCCVKSESSRRSRILFSVNFFTCFEWYPLKANANLDQLIQAADFVRKSRMGDTLEFCAIINGKSGGCSEDCAFCAQSRYGNGERYPLLDQKELVRQAEYYRDQGIGRTSVVTAGKRLSEREIKTLEQVYRKIKGIALCASHGLLSQSELKRLKATGVVRYHCNLETSRSFFPKICTTHTFDQKLETIRAAKKAGLSLCSGLLIGMGETIYDRIDAAFTLRELGAESVPVNILVQFKNLFP